MKRRGLLGVFTACLPVTTGCLAGPGTPSDGDDDTELLVDSLSVSERGSSTETAVTIEPTIVRDRITSARPGEIQLALQNTGDEALTVSTGPIPPFGVLKAAATDGNGEFVLWNDRYLESSHVQTEDGSVTAVADVGRRFEIDPGATIKRTYAVRSESSSVAPGEYRVVNFSGDDLRFNSVTYTVTLTLVESTT